MRRLLLVAAAGVVTAVAGATASHAQEVDPTGRWVTLFTPHFRVHVRPELRDLGLAAAAEAESAWDALAAVLRPPSSTVDLVVSDHSDLSNGSATTYPRPRILVQVTPPAADLQVGVYDRWLRLVVTHELAHIFQLETVGGWWRVPRALFGRAPGLFPSQNQPSWMHEGLAVFYESKVTGAGRLDASFHDVSVRAARSVGPIPIDAAGAISPRWPAGIRPYAFGGSFFSALSSAYGDSVVPRLVTRAASQPVPWLQLNGALRSATGRSFTEAWTAWMASDTMAGASAASARAPRAIVEGLRAPLSPRLSPDGSMLIAFADGRETAHLMALEATGGHRRLSRLNAASGFAWDTGGSALVAQLEFTDQYNLRSDLWRVAPDGRETRLTSGARLFEPDVGADGTVLAVRLTNGGGRELVLLGHSGVRVLASAAAGIEWAQPRFSPDGRTVAAVRVRHGRHDVVVLSSDGELLAELTDDPARDLSPAFTPDGTALVWSRELAGRPQIVGTRLDGGSGLFVLTDEPFGAYAPEAGRGELFYLGYRPDGFALVAVPWNERAVAAAEARSAGTEETALAPAEVRREEGYAAWRTLLPAYWTPVLRSNTAGGTWLGAFTSGSDALRRHWYSASVSLGLGAAAGTWSGSLDWVWAAGRRTSLDLFLERDNLAFPGTGGVACCVLDESASAGVTLRRVRWRRSAAVRLGGEYDRTAAISRSGVVLGAAWSTAQRPALSISNQDGATLGATLRQRWRTDAGLNSSEATVRASLYRSFRADLFARPVLALRVAAGGITGTDNRAFGVGGESGTSIEVIPGFAVGSDTRTFPVRGFLPATLIGRRAATAAVEQRIPLSLVGRGFRLLPVTLDRISVAVFADGGVAWSGAYCPAGLTRALCAEHIGSAGGELVVDLGVASDVPLRLRLGSAARFAGGRGVVVFGAVGPAF